MRKFYSFVLIAAALLIGTNAWGQNTVNLVNATDASKSGDYSTLQAAIDAIAPGQTGTITLNGPQNLDAGVLIPHLSAADTVGGKRIANLERQHITINLNGFDIMTKTSTSDACIALIKGELNITGEGTIERAAVAYSDNWNRGAILVSGTDGMKDGYTGNWPVYNGVGISVLPADKVDRSKQEWSSLYIDKDVYVESTQADTYGIGVQEIGSSCPGYGGFSKEFLGYSCVYTGLLNNTDNAMPMWNTTQGRKAAPNQDQLKETQTQWSCFGVKVVIDGKVHGAVRGVNVLGSINQTPGVVEGATDRKYAAYPYYDHYFPYIKIGKDAEVYCEPYGISDNGNGGIYLGGWAIVDIEGAVHGQTGVMVKAGDVLVQNGSVYSDCTTAANSGNYHATVAGSGIFITSSASYAGESSVTVAGDSYIAGNGGNAIIDVCATSTSEQTNTAVSHIDITGGTIVAGDQGAISLGTNTSNVTDIKGGIVNGVVDIGDPSDEEQRFHTDVTNLLPNTDNYHTTVIADEGGKQTIVISQGEAPATEPGQATTPWSWCADDAQTGKNVAWTRLEDDAIPQNTTITLGELQIVSGTGEGAGARQQLTINSGAILQVDHLVMNDYARIIVKAGGKLIVKGTQGIVAPVVENITLESSESAQAYFLFHPEVSSNRHPNATVKLTSKGYVKNGDYDQKVWQRFGVPAYTSKVEEGAVTRKSTNKIEYNDAGWIAAYDYSIDNWISMPDEDAFVPFQCYEASSVATEPNHTIYTFKCPLMGNSDFTLPLNAYTEWNYYANSYMAPINIEQMLTSFVTNDAKVKGTVYVYRSEDNWWDNINLGQLGYFPTAAQTKIDPMQAFIFQKNEEGAADAVINYKKHIYNPDPTTTPVAAPARNHEVFSAAIVEIAAADGAKDKLYLIESDKFTADFDNGYDAAKYMNNESFNIFADEQLGIIATDNLEGTAISMTSKAQTSFTMTFNNVTNMEYAIRDNLTGTETAIEEGATYMFSVAADANADGRFEIVPLAKMPTSIENIEATAAAKGIYTVSGQFVGNNYHSLPKGIYVVDGKKIVK